jgi:hypothetical protein
MNLDDIVGTWDLVEYQLLRGGDARPLWPSIRGRLTYTHDGFVSVVIVRMLSTELQNSDVITYSGTYKLRDGFVDHSIFVSNISRYVDSRQSRKIEFKRDKLILMTTEPIKDYIHMVVWKRMKK